MNPFLNKPLRKVQPGGSTEHRPSKVLNKNIAKNPQILNASKNASKNPSVRQSFRNPSPSDKNSNNNINIISQNNLVNEEEKNVNEVNTNSFTSNIQSERNIEINYPYISEKNSDDLIFKSDDEIFAYLKNKIKAGKIENINQKLEVKKNDFTGFTLSKKSNGFSIYEIEVEDNIDKINELFKKQKIEINKKPIEFVYTGGPSSSTSSTAEDDPNSKVIKKPKVKVDNKFRGENKKPESFMTALKKKINERFEKENAVVKNEKNDEIANLKNKINKYKGDLKKEEQKEIEAIKRPSNRYVLSTLTVDEPDKRRESLMRGKGNQKETNNITSINSNVESKAKESERRMSKAYNRFKKAFSNKKDNNLNLNHKHSEKISSLAEMLKEHIIKPLADIEEEAELRPRGGSVELRVVKESEVVNLLEHAPVVQKKKAKKPKGVNFGEQ